MLGTKLAGGFGPITVALAGLLTGPEAGGLRSVTATAHGGALSISGGALTSPPAALAFSTSNAFGHFGITERAIHHVKDGLKPSVHKV